MTVTIDRIAQLDDAITGTAPAPAADQEPAQAPRPSWQDRPCPPWCMMSIPHRDEDMPDDRYHMSLIHQMDLTLNEAVTVYSATGELIASGPACFSASLFQHYRERDPHIALIHNEKVDIQFTAAEASELARALTALAGGDSAQDAQCPSWCTDGPHADPFIGDRNHAGDYTMVTLTLAEPDVCYSPKPWPAGELPEPEVTLPDISVRLWQDGASARPGSISSTATNTRTLPSPKPGN